MDSSTPIWPTGLPLAQQNPTIKGTPRNLSTQMESGRFRIRRVYEEPLKTIDVVWNFTQDQFENFRSFFDDVLHNGSISFMNQIFGDVREMAFMANYSFSRSDNLFAVSASLQYVSSMVIPVALPATNIAFVNFDANWEALGGPMVGYFLDVSSTIDFSSFLPGFQNRNVGNVLTFTVTGLDAATSYYYRVRANFGSFVTSNSNRISLITSSLSPASFSGLAGWWKADSFVGLVDGDAVGGSGREWIDQVGVSNHHGRQATAGLKPIYKVNIANGKPALLFTWATDFSDQHFLDASNGSEGNSIIPAGDYTVIAVVKPSSLSTRVGGTIIGQAYAGNNCSVIVLGPSVDSLKVYDGVSSNQSLPFTSQVDILGMYSYVRSGGNLSYFRNKANITNGAPGAINQGRFNFIGAASAPPVDARWGGYIMEISIWTTALSSTDIATLYDQYYQPRWGLP